MSLSAVSPSTSTDKVQLQICGVTKDFDGVLAVNNVDLSIYQGEIFALLGASGCGKTTLLRMLAGFEIPSTGSILLDGQDLSALPPYQRPMNMMFQSYALFPHMTVEKNIAFGLKQDKLPKQQIADKVDEVLALVQMTAYARRKPHQLSGGQQQRVALARSLAKSPKLLLLDEPMGALDKKLRTRMQLEIVNILEEVGVTCVMVTHDQEEAMTMADRVGIMNNGVLTQVGTPMDVYEQPNCRMTAEFIGSANIFDGVLAVDEADYIEVNTSVLDSNLYIGHGITGTRGMELAVAIRPEKINVSKDEPAQIHNKARGVVEDIAYLGSHSVYHIRLASGFKIMASVVNSNRHLVSDEDRITWEDEVFVSWSETCGVVLYS
jgi:putrescine transport system ATP-binding protein